MYTHVNWHNEEFYYFFVNIIILSYYFKIDLCIVITIFLNEIKKNHFHFHFVALIAQ